MESGTSDKNTYVNFTSPTAFLLSINPSTAFVWSDPVAP